MAAIAGQIMFRDTNQVLPDSVPGSKIVMIIGVARVVGDLPTNDQVYSLIGRLDDDCIGKFLMENMGEPVTRYGTPGGMRVDQLLCSITWRLGYVPQGLYDALE